MHFVTESLHSISPHSTSISPICYPAFPSSSLPLSHAHILSLPPPSHFLFPLSLTRIPTAPPSIASPDVVNSSRPLSPSHVFPPHKAAFLPSLISPSCSTPTFSLWLPFTLPNDQYLNSKRVVSLHPRDCEIFPLRSQKLVSREEDMIFAIHRLLDPKGQGYIVVNREKQQKTATREKKGTGSTMHGQDCLSS